MPPDLTEESDGGELGDGEPSDETGLLAEATGPVDWSTWLSDHLEQSSTRALGTSKAEVPAERVQLEPVAGRSSFPERELTPDLPSVQEAIEGPPRPRDQPVGPDAALDGDVRQPNETVNAPSSRSSSQVLNGLAELRQAVAGLSTGTDSQVMAALHALRIVVGELVDVVADLPSALRRVVNARLDEDDAKVMKQAFERMHQASSEFIEAGPPTVRLDEAQMRAIVSAVVEAVSREGPITIQTRRSHE